MKHHLVVVLIFFVTIVLLSLVLSTGTVHKTHCEEAGGVLVRSKNNGWVCIHKEALMQNTP
jgi:hypothetical protein